MTTLINVCGATRSGTTMLDLMLGHGSDAFSCGEVYAMFRPWMLHHFKAECRCGQVPCPVWEKIRYVPEDKFHATVFEELEVSFVSDSSKDLCWLIDSQNWAVANGIKVVKLLLWKDPVSLSYSHWKRGNGLKGWYGEFISYYTQFFETGLPFRTVYFNDLVRDPHRKLMEICAAVGMPYFDGKERFWEGQHHYLFGSHGTYLQVKEKGSTIRASENFPPEFKKQVDVLLQQIAQDEKIQRILQTLQQAEVSSRGGFNAEEQAVVVRWPYPMWYYARKVKQIVRRYFPDRSGAVK